jgi:hypothetical protein
MGSIVTLFEWASSRVYNGVSNSMTYPLARSGLLLHSITMSQNRRGQSPTETTIRTAFPKYRESKYEKSTNRIEMRVELMRNLAACFTVPSVFSWLIAVGRYDIKLNKSWSSCICTSDPVKSLQTMQVSYKEELTLEVVDDKIWLVHEIVNSLREEK